MCLPKFNPSNLKILKIIIMVVLIRNGGGHCNNDVVSPAMQSVAAFRTPIPTSCKLSITLEPALIFEISCCLRSQVKCYDTKIASDEAIVINPNYSHILDYCKFFDIFTPLICFYFHIFSVLTFVNKEVKCST